LFVVVYQSINQSIKTKQNKLYSSRIRQALVIVLLTIAGVGGAYAQQQWTTATVLSNGKFNLYFKAGIKKFGIPQCSRGVLGPKIYAKNGG